MYIYSFDVPMHRVYIFHVICTPFNEPVFWHE